MRCLLVAIQLSKLPSEVHYSVRSSFSAEAASRYLFSIKFYRLSEQRSQLLCHSTKGIDRRSDISNKQRKQKKTFPTSEELTDRAWDAYGRALNNNKVYILRKVLLEHNQDTRWSNETLK